MPAGDGPSGFRALLRTLRPHQWTKNLLLVVPALAAHLTPTPALGATALTGFLGFSLTASAVYVINDVADRRADRRHPEKRHRPIAAGDLSIPVALAVAAGCLLAAAGLAWTLPPGFGLVLGAYLTLNVAYSFDLKGRAVLDVVVLAALYTARVVAGAELVEVELTGWFLAFSIFLFFSLALVKRVAELARRAEDGEDGEVPGRPYRTGDLEFLRTAGLATGAMSALVYCLYITGAEVRELYGQPRFLWIGLPLLLYGLVRFWLIADRGEMDEDPVAFLLRDRTSYLIGAAFLGAVFLAA